MGANSQPPANLDDWLPTGNTGSLATGITDHTRSMFRAILAENGIADVDEAILEQEMVMFFKFSELQRWACHVQTNRIQHVRIESGWEGQVILLTAR